MPGGIDPQSLGRADVARVVLSIVRSRLAQLRCVSPSNLLWNQEHWQMALSDALGVSSIELSEFFHLHETRLDDSLLLQPRLEHWVDLILEHARQSAFSFYTSGSTGEPKLCTHGFANLWQEVEFFAAQIQPKRILSLVPEHHIYGFLWTVLLPKCAGVNLLSGDTAQQAALRSARSGDLVVATPPVWDYLLRSWGEVEAGVVGVTSTAPMPSATASALRSDKLGTLYEIYGASESMALGYRRETNAEYQLLPYLAVKDSATLFKRNVAGFDLNYRCKII